MSSTTDSDPLRISTQYYGTERSTVPWQCAKTKQGEMQIYSHLLDRLGRSLLHRRSRTWGCTVSARRMWKQDASVMD